MEKNCVIVIGPEGSGSMMVARICAHVLGIAEYGSWDSIGWIENKNHKVCHRSLPYSLPPRWPNIDEMIAQNRDEYEIKFVLTTRDITISEFSRMHRFGKSLEQATRESATARQLMHKVLRSEFPYIIWSYESFMFLGKSYLDELYSLLRIQSDFMPELRDGNKLRILRVPDAPAPRVTKYLRRLISKARHYI